VYAHKLTYSDEVLWPQNRGAITIANYTFIIDIYKSNTHKYMLESTNFTNNLTKNKIQTENNMNSLTFNCLRAM